MLNDKYIQNLIENKEVAQIYLVNGIKLSGRILEQDDKSFTMEGKDTKRKQLVFKTAVATVNV